MRWRAITGLGVWWLVAVGAATGLAIVVFGGAIRAGGMVMSASFVLGAALRLVIPSPRGGGLEVRRRLVDVVLLLGLAAGIFLAFALVRPAPL